MIELTNEQHAAVENRGGPLLISAAAGSGKTSVLVRRMISRLEEGDGKSPNIDAFLVITYTRAAAAELRHRIRQELLKSIEQHPNNRHLARQLNRVHRARIETIHAFCSGILRENTVLSGLPAGFRLADAQETNLLRMDCAEKALEILYERFSGDTPFGILAEALSDLRGDRRLGELVLEIDEKMQGRPSPLSWLARRLTGDAVYWEDAQLRRVRREAEDTLCMLEAAWEVLEDTPALHGAYGPAFQDDLESWKQLLHALENGWQAAADYAAGWPASTALGRTRAEPECREFLRAQRERAKKRKEKVIDKLTCGHEDNQRALEDAGLLAAGLLDALRVFREVYTEEKKRRGMADFSDLEHRALALLWDENGQKPSDTAQTLAGRFYEILVDEYQDVNEVQERILQALSFRGNLFMVGDARQSIYRFRMADPRIFLEKYRTYPDAGQAVPGEGRKLLLSRNFRSRAAILTAVNDVFARIMSRETGEMDYTEREYLTPGREDDAAADQPGLTLWITDRALSEDEKPRLALEAEQVAARVAGLCGEGTAPGDVVILLRSYAEGEPIFRQALEQAGIPCASGDGSRFFEAQEVAAALSYLAVLDNPSQDVPLLAVMRSPAYGFTPDELAEIRLASPEVSLWEALVAAADAGREKALLLRGHIADLRALAPDLRVDRLLWRVYRLTNFPERYAALPGGQERYQNLMVLSDLALEAEKTSYQGLYGFLALMEKRKEKGFSPAAAGGRDAVRIMSIHKSKGLEFPVVILADSVRRFNRVDINKSILFHTGLGAGCPWYDRERHVFGTTVYREVIRETLEDELAAEEMRMLYVALTRAQKRLIVSAVFDDAQKTLKTLAQRLIRGKITPFAAREASCHAEWLVLTALSLMDSGELPAHWRIDILPPAEVSGRAREIVCAAPAQRETLEEHAEEKERAPFVYPYLGTGLPSKMTATGLKGRFQDEEAAEETGWPSAGSVFEQPRFVSGQRGLTPAERGVAMHLFMQHADFENARADAEKEVDRLLGKGLLTHAQAQAVDPQAVARLLNGALGKRLLAAARVLRECKFSLLADAGRWHKEAAGEQFLLQGVIDCAFWENDGWVILDFKTDRIRPGQAALRAGQYAGQLDTYSWALTRMTGQPVRQALLYFFETDETAAVECCRETS